MFIYIFFWQHFSLSEIALNDKDLTAIKAFVETYKSHNLQL